MGTKFFRPSHPPGSSIHTFIYQDNLLVQNRALTIRRPGVHSARGDIPGEDLLPAQEASFNPILTLKDPRYRETEHRRCSICRILGMLRVGWVGFEVEWVLCVVWEREAENKREGWTWRYFLVVRCSVCRMARCHDTKARVLHRHLRSKVVCVSSRMKN